MDEITKKTNTAFKWSTITELLAKIISPLINMLLARILAPEAFGVLATITMILSFAEVFVESGFQKFLIQHDFDSPRRESQYMSVAFWSNLIFSGMIGGVVAVFCDPLAALVGNDGLGLPIAVSGVAVPLYGIIGIQDCRLKKQLNFRALFFVRIISAFVPLFVTVPLALLGFDYWSLVIGNIAGLLVRSVLLLLFGKFKPLLYFRWTDLKHMLSVGVWTMLDGIFTWMTSWVDSLLISHYMSDYYLGLYKNASSTIVSLFSIVTSALVPVLYASLSKLQHSPKEFNRTFLGVQKALCTFLLPLSVGVYLYRDFATGILFGDQWLEAADIVGIMALSTALRTIFVSMCSDVYRAKGKFVIPLLLQILDVAILIPVCVLSVQYGFWTLVYARAFVKLDLVIPEIICLWIICGITLKDTVVHIAPSVIATLSMAVTGYALRLVGTSFLWTVASVGICIIEYFAVLFLFKSERESLLMSVKKKLKR